MSKGGHCHLSYRRVTDVQLSSADEQQSKAVRGACAPDRDVVDMLRRSLGDGSPMHSLTGWEATSGGRLDAAVGSIRPVCGLPGSAM
jgi:hypothetical protein